MRKYCKENIKPEKGNRCKNSTQLCNSRLIFSLARWSIFRNIKMLVTCFCHSGVQQVVNCIFILTGKLFRKYTLHPKRCVGLSSLLDLRHSLHLYYLDVWHRVLTIKHATWRSMSRHPASRNLSVCSKWYPTALLSPVWAISLLCVTGVQNAHTDAENMYDSRKPEDRQTRLLCILIFIYIFTFKV